MARTIQTHELSSFSIQDWTRGQRWGDAVAGDVEMDWTRLPSGGKRPWFLCPSCGRRCGPFGLRAPAYAKVSDGHGRGHNQWRDCRVVARKIALTVAKGRAFAASMGLPHGRTRVAGTGDLIPTALIIDLCAPNLSIRWT